jgi:hypothetical protein
LDFEFGRDLCRQSLPRVTWTLDQFYRLIRHQANMREM